MGWDCYATRDGDHDNLTEDDLAVFRTLAGEIRSRHKWVDGDLATGGLNLSGCGTAIEYLTGLNAWAEDDSSPETIQGISRDVLCYTGEPYEDNAVAFLTACIERGLGVRWSW